MKAILLLLFTCIGSINPTVLQNSTWTFKVANGCTDILKFKPKGQATSYDCELDYTFHCTYILKQDTLILTEKDDSHSEDGEKINYHRTKYVIKSNTLYAITKGELVNSKWKETKVKGTNLNWQRKF